MRTGTEFISEISAPTIPTSFKFHLDFLVNLGEVDVHDDPQALKTCTTVI